MARTSLFMLTVWWHTEPWKKKYISNRYQRKDSPQELWVDNKHSELCPKRRSCISLTTVMKKILRQTEKIQEEPESSKLQMAVDVVHSERNSSVSPHFASLTDMILESLLSRHSSWIAKYHEHESLLQEDEEDRLSKEEADMAWQTFQRSLVVEWEEVHWTVVDDSERMPVVNVATPKCHVPQETKRSSKNETIQVKYTKLATPEVNVAIPKGYVSQDTKSFSWSSHSNQKKSVFYISDCLPLDSRYSSVQFYYDGERWRDENQRCTIDCYVIVNTFFVSEEFEPIQAMHSPVIHEGRMNMDVDDEHSRRLDNVMPSYGTTYVLMYLLALLEFKD